MYTDGQIITKEEHITFANWNNANGGKFRSESLGNSTVNVPNWYVAGRAA